MQIRAMRAKGLVLKNYLLYLIYVPICSFIDFVISSDGHKFSKFQCPDRFNEIHSIYIPESCKSK